MLSHNNQSSLSSSRISNADVNEFPIDEYKRASIFPEVVEVENGKKQDDYKEVDVGKLSPAEKQLFIDKIIEVVEEDNERFLKKLRKRIDRIGIQLPTIQIRFEHLSVQAKCHVGSRALPTLLNSTMNFVESTMGFLGIGQTKLANLAILKDVSGILKPSRMTLLLGPPASGKTTLLLALAGILDSNLESMGDVTYNGYRLDEFVPQKTAAYISQYDLHVGEMTVKETLDFSARCQGIGSRYDLLKELTKKEMEANISPDPEVDLFMKATAQNGIKSSLQTDYILKILGLDMCADTIIGDEMLRGISGGQKKRLTTGEMIVGPTKTLFMDEISTGLDSSTTYQIVSCLKHIVQLGEATVLMSLLQPAPETFNLFDDIILLCEGQIVYQGPTEYVLDFFKSCGFECPNRKGTADFLQEVTSKKDQEQYWAKETQSYHFISVSEFASRFKKYHIGCALENELSLPFDKMKSHEAALVFSKNLVPISELLMASFDKEWLLIKRNSSVYVFLVVKLVIVATITSTVFLKTQMHTNTEGDGAIYLGALIYGIIITMFNGFTELAFSMFRLPVFFKQRDLLFYPAWVFTLPNILVKIPISILESFVWVSMTYYSIGLAPEASRFFKMLLIIILIQQTAAGLFRLIAAIFRTMVRANGGGSMVFLCLFVLGGFLIPKDKIPSWWIWGYWISPMPYAYNAIAVNEFFSPRWMDKFAPDGRRLGVAVLENGSIFVDKNWYWIGAGGLLVYTIVCNVSFTLALTYFNSPGRQQAIISEDILDTDKTDDAKDYSRNTVQRGMILPFTPLIMSFKDVNYHVDMPAEMKAQGVQGDKLELLKGVTGAFRPGVLTALMGISGAGKTTLMDVLSGRKTGGYIEGDIRISGYPKNQATFARISGYCEQNDIHSPQVTVKESLIYSAFLRLPPDVTASKKMKFVDDVMELVELENIRDAIVGLPGISGLSTEQRKRLTVAVELVSNPAIIFMDEPTSGLDARSAAIVMRAVRNTVNTGRTVVCTIHQPSIDIFESFDELLLLKRGGQVVYSGPLGNNSQKMIEYFESIPGIAKIKDQYNPATWMLEVSSTAIEVKLDINFAEIYRSSSLFKRNNEIVDALREPVPGTEDLHFPTQYAQSNYEQFKSCLWKQMLTYWRSPDYNMTRFLFSWSSAFMLGSMFWNIGKRRESSSDIVMTLAAMFAAVLFAGFQNAATVQPVVATERTVFYREKAAGMYSGLPYAFAQMAMEIPYVFIQTVFYVLIIYSMFGLEWAVDKFFWFFFVAFFTFLYFTYYGMMFVAISPNVQVAGLLCATFFTLFNLFCGFFIPKARIPKWWIWYYWMDPVQWTINGLITTQFGDLEDMITVPGQSSQSIKSYIGDQFGLHLDFMYAVALVLVGFTLLFAFVFAFGIKKLNFQQR